MTGIIYAIIAGALIGLQNVFNARVGDKIGLLETTMVVHAVGLIFALILMAFYRSGGLGGLKDVNKLYLLGGAFGVVIVFSAMKGLSLLGASYSTAILLVTQLIIATIIDSFGLFGSPQVKFDITKLLGVVVMVIGIVIFKWKG